MVHSAVLDSVARMFFAFWRLDISEPIARDYRYVRVATRRYSGICVGVLCRQRSDVSMKNGAMVGIGKRDITLSSRVAWRWCGVKWYLERPK